MTDEAERENSREVEIYGELGMLPKIGVKIRLAQKARIDRVIDSAAEYAELDRGQLEDRLVDSDDRVRDVVFMAALRAGEVDDDDYLDALGRLISGALDGAAIDELTFITSEVTKLEPVHLRALLGFFYFGQEGAENPNQDLSPADAAWATNRFRADREVANLLKMTPDSTSQVLLRLDRDGFIHLNGGPGVGDEATSGPRPWAGRVLSTLFPSLTVEFRNTIDGGGVGESVSTPPAPERGVVAIPDGDLSARERRAIAELETEIKGLERRRLSPMGLDLMGGDDKWLALLKRRLRTIDPDNPWTHDVR